MVLSDTQSLRRKLDFLLFMQTEGSGQLNISIQLVATCLDLVLNIFMNAPAGCKCIQRLEDLRARSKP